MLYYQSGHMCQLFEKFPEVLLVDATYNVNKVGMPLYCLMVEDGFGNGRVVFYAATAEEDTSHLEKMIQSFKEENPCWPSARVIIVDKDYTEWKLLKAEFPAAAILFCQWHIIKAIFKKVGDYDVEKSKRDMVKDTIRHLVYSKTDKDYRQLRPELFDNNNDMIDCQGMWVTYKRDKYLHLENTTNNRLESHNQKLKGVTTQSSSLSEMVENVLLYSQISAAEYSKKSFLEELTTLATEESSVPGAQEVISFCTQFAAGLMIEQLKLAISVDYKFCDNDDEDTYIGLSTNGDSYTVDISLSTCSCNFSKTLSIPCRHIFATRAHNCLPLFEPSMVAKRWLKNYQLCDGEEWSDCNDSEVRKFHVSQLNGKALLTGTLAKNQKYRKMLTLCQKVAVIASEQGIMQFRRMYSDIETVINY